MCVRSVLNVNLNHLFWEEKTLRVLRMFTILDHFLPKIHQNRSHHGILVTCLSGECRDAKFADTLMIKLWPPFDSKRSHHFLLLIANSVACSLTLYCGGRPSKSVPNHGQTLANRTKPGPSFQLQTWACVHIHEFHTHLQNSLTYSWKLGPNKF